MTPYPSGIWPSPISPDMLVSGAVAIGDVIPDGDDLWWAESRPDDGGRTALVRWRDGSTQEMTPPGANVRTLVHEYGGGAWWVEEKVLYFVEFHDQRLRRLDPDGAIVLLSREPAQPRGVRYADFRPTPDRHWLIGIEETHGPQQSEPRNRVVAVACDGSMRTHVLADGADFVAAVRTAPDGQALAWFEWQHPHMPWDTTCLYRATLHSTADDIHIDDRVLIAGGDDESVIEPRWSPDGVLHYLSDRSNSWQVYAEGTEQAVTALDGDIGVPHWVFGAARYTFDERGEVKAVVSRGGRDHLPALPEFSAISALRHSGPNLSCRVAGFHSESAVWRNGDILRTPRSLGLHADFLPAPEAISFPVADGTATSHALFYPPANADYTCLPDERPPLIVMAHGGPTSSARTELSLALRFWTSRGFAVADVNYRGSSGYGRRYRDALKGQWGIADVEDCVAVAHYLADRGDVDRQRLIIRGGSAGGFTVLSALAFHDVFTAGANLYGVADLAALAGDTHKFESRYLDSLVGPWPEARDVYEARSPIHHLDGFNAPMIVLQGAEDRIVPPNQSRRIVDALEARQVAVEYLEFADEQHGFRKAENIVAAYTAELAFYIKVFGITAPS